MNWFLIQQAESKEIKKRGDFVKIVKIKEEEESGVEGRREGEWGR